MKINNKWLYGKTALKGPQLPVHLWGRSGCHVEVAVFDTNIGEEVYLVIQEDGGYCQELSKIVSVAFRCKSGVVRTNNGLVCFLIVSVYDEEIYVGAYEVFLTPCEIETIRMLSSWGQQTHLKVLLLDCHSSKCVHWWEVENVFNTDPRSSQNSPKL